MEPEAKVWNHYEFETAEFGLCKIWFFTKKSYIRFWDFSKKEGAGDWTLLVGLENEKDQQQHKEICNALVWHAKQRGATKEKLQSLRADLIADANSVDVS